MKVTPAKKQLFAKSKVFYVSSESGREKHIVIRTKNVCFCDCKDFMTRRLPLFKTSGFSLCKHGKAVQKRNK